MSGYETSIRRISKLWETITFVEQKVDLLKEFHLHSASSINASRNILTSITHTPIIYDLYRFLGVTYTNNESLAVPAELYTANEDDTVFTFNLPVYGYAVPQYTDPFDSTGVDTWEYQLSVAIIKTRINYANITSDIVHRSNLFTYLTTDNNTEIPSLQILIDPIKEIYTDFSHFFRWIELTSGYDLEIYAFYPLVENINLSLITNVVFMTQGAFNEIQPYKIKNIKTQ